MNKRICSIGFVILGIGAFMVLVRGNRQSVVVADAVAGWTKGADMSLLTLVEYSDLQCPACGAYHPILNQLLKEFDGKVKFEYRHFPLRDLHVNAERAARATEAAGKQGKFWEMHDVLFEKQTEWSESKTPDAEFERYATTLGIDIARFRADVVSDEVAKKIELERKSGITLKIRGTPTFLLNGKMIENPQSLGEFRSLIEQELHASQK